MVRNVLGKSRILQHSIKALVLRRKTKEERKKEREEKAQQQAGERKKTCAY